MIHQEKELDHSNIFGNSASGENKKNPAITGFLLAGATGFEPAVSALTGPHVKPLHHAPAGDESLT
jgi:hypothetical protein